MGLFDPELGLGVFSGIFTLLWIYPSIATAQIL